MSVGTNSFSKPLSLERSSDPSSWLAAASDLFEF